MKPPIFAPPPMVSMPQAYLHRARMFRDAAIGLPDYVNNETNWPAYAIMLHACELALKAFCDQSVANGAAPGTRTSHHDLQGWYDRAVAYGLPNDPGVAEGIADLHEIHSSHFTRYPSHGHGPRARDLSAARDVVERLILAATAVVNRR